MPVAVHRSQRQPFFLPDTQVDGHLGTEYVRLAETYTQRSAVASCHVEEYPRCLGRLQFPALCDLTDQIQAACDTLPANTC